jgi:N-acetylmuramoyl-L-alanine amidase
LRAGAGATLSIVVSAFVVAASCVGGGSRAEPTRIPRRDGPLAIELRYPTDGSRIVEDSTAIWGTVGSGGATLEVNGQRIRAEGNGAFAGFVGLPAGDTVTLELVARRGKETVHRRVEITRTVPPTVEHGPLRPIARWVRLSRMPSDTVDSATQARPIFTRWRPGGGLALAIEQGIRLPSDRRTDDAFRLRVAPDLFVWAEASEVDTLAGGRPVVVRLSGLRIDSDADEVEVSVRTGEPIPTHVEAVPAGLVWTLYGGVLDSRAVEVPQPGFVRELVLLDAGPERTEFAITLESAPLGWRVDWREGRLTLRIRTPRPVHAGLRDLIVALDAGHPPGGTVGPDGLREDSMTLAVARVAAQRLRSLGARPVLIRDDDESVSLDERIARADEAGTHVYISIHGNSPGSGRPPGNVAGTIVYWEQPNAFRLGRSMLDGVSTALAQPVIGLTRSDFAVIRPTWYPAVLVEGTGLVLPELEARLRSPDGIEAYADGIVAGVSDWAAQWARQARASQTRSRTSR